MAPPTPLPLAASLQPILATNSQACTATSPFMVFLAEGPVSHLTSATTREPTRTRRAAWMASEFKPSTFRCKLVCWWFVHYRTCALYTWGFSFWRCGQGSHVLASCRQLHCHGELVGLEEGSRIISENALYKFCPICDSKQASMVPSRFLG